MVSDSITTSGAPDEETPPKEVAKTSGGHVYNNVTSSDKAKQLVGNAGEFKEHLGRNEYSQVQAKDESIQVVGNMAPDAFAAFMGH